MVFISCSWDCNNDYLSIDTYIIVVLDIAISVQS